MNKPLLASMVATFLLIPPAFADEDRSIDPYEPYNRVMFKINDTADRYVMTPVARGYRAVTPSPVRTGVSNFFNNLRDVVSVGSNLLRLDIEKASTDLVRVGINTTFGIGGLINIADAGQMPNNKNTLGDTFASWGWKNSNYFVYPLSGPSTVRDSVGSTIIGIYPVEHAVFQHNAARNSIRVVEVVDRRQQLLDLTDSLDEAAVDKYAYTRDLFMRMRNQKVGVAPTTSADDNIDIDELVSDEDGTSATLDQQQAEATTSALNINSVITQDNQFIQPLWQPQSNQPH